MSDMQPHTISPKEWEEIIKLPAVREAWGLWGPTADLTPKEFAESVYGVKFNFFSGSPGYVGDLYTLQGDALTGTPPMMLTRNEDHHTLIAHDFSQ